MKNLLLFLLILFSSIAYGQVPNQINYQGIARNSVGNVLSNKNISIRLSIHDGSSTGSIVYQELRNITTSNFGLFSIAIGSSGATFVTGTIATVNWGSGAKFLQVEIDPAGGSNFIDLGAAQLLSVPYALFSGNAINATPTGVAGGDLSGNYPSPFIADSAVTTNKLGANSVTTSKIADGSITSAKFASGVIPISLPPNGAAGGDLSGTYPNPTIGVDAITTSKILDGSVTFSKLAPGIIPTSLPPNGAAGGDLSGTYPNPTIGVDAITTSKILDGSVTFSKLAPGIIPTSLPPIGAAGGDLSGTYPNPIVSQIQGILINNTTPVTGQVLKFDGTQWSPGTDNSGSGNPTGPAGGDLSGTYPNPTIGVNAITTSKILDGSVTLSKLAPGVIPTSLTPNGAAGGDLIGTYPNPTIGVNAITTTKIADGSVTLTKLAAGIIPTSLPPIGAAGGDLSGTYPNPTVNQIQGVLVNNTTPVTGQVLKFDGTQWSPGTDNVGSGGGPTGSAGGDLSGNYPNPNIASGAVTTPKIANGSIVTPKVADGAITAAKLAAGVIPTSLPPNGAAGGDLTGTYPNPTIGINAITTTKIADGSVTLTKLVAGVIPTSLPPNGAAGGDLTGTYPNPMIGVNAITTIKIADGSVTLTKLAAGVIPTSLPPNGAAGGDLTGTYPNPSVSKLVGIPLNAIVPTAGQVLKFDGVQWSPGTDNTGAFSLPYSNTLSSTQNLISLTNSGTGGGLEGINSSTNANAFGVIGRISSASPGTSSAALRGINSGMNPNGYGVWGSHSGYGFGVYGTSVNNNGIEGYSANSNGIFGTSDQGAGGWFDISNASNGSDAMDAFTVGTGNGVYASSDQGNGVWGITYSASASGIFGLNAGGGEAITGMSMGSSTAAISGTNFANNGIGISAVANSGGAINGTALLASLESTGGDIAVFQVGGTNMARIDDTGKGFFNGGTQNSGADVAEAFDIEGERKDYEPGDVLVISTNADRKVERSSEPYSTLVAGVYATKPGVLLTEKNAEQDQLDNTVPMGVIGVIPTKVCMEGGAIKRGDLIVTSSTPGVAMKADPDKVKVGQVIGKALQEYNQAGIGKINVLVSIK